MGETTAVALLFDDVELGGHLRDALREGGARIVHEGTLNDLSRELILRVGADVVVINLDDSADEALDRLDEAIDGDHPRVVFNEAQSSRGLDGWDRARWARHLAAKVLARSDIDPPRPLVEAAAAPAAAEIEPVETPSATMPGDAADSAEAEVPTGESHEAQTAAESESLAAELEALLASEPLPGDEATTGDDEDGAAFALELDTLALDEIPDDSTDGPGDEPLYDGDFLNQTADATPPLPESDASSLDLVASDFSLDDLSLLEDDVESVGIAAPASPATDTMAAGAAPRLSDGWSLVDDDAPSAPAESDNDETLTLEPSRPDPSAFGIEKLSAADYLAPDVQPSGEDEEAFLSLELVSLEDAIAPTPYEGAEMLLNELGGALTRVVMTGAAATSRTSVMAFFSQLPAGMRATVVHTQHLAGQPVESLVEELAAACALPVRLAADGQVARIGEVLVVPPDSQLRLLREGKLELGPAQDMPASSPSIDGSFTAAANVFGSDALAIVFAGQANDAVAGCQAVHDRGGRIWVEDAPGEHFADMVSGVLAERLADFSGTPAALAARLIEEYS